MKTITTVKTNLVFIVLLFVPNITCVGSEQSMKQTILTKLFAAFSRENAIIAGKFLIEHPKIVLPVVAVVAGVYGVKRYGDWCADTAFVKKIKRMGKELGLIRESVNEIQEGVGRLENGQIELQEGQARLERGQLGLQEGQKVLENGQNAAKKDRFELRKGQKMLQKILGEGQKRLENEFNKKYGRMLKKLIFVEDQIGSLLTCKQFRKELNFHKRAIKRTVKTTIKETLKELLAEQTGNHQKLLPQLANFMGDSNIFSEKEDSNVWKVSPMSPKMPMFDNCYRNWNLRPIFYNSRVNRSFASVPNCVGWNCFVPIFYGSHVNYTESSHSLAVTE